MTEQDRIGGAGEPLRGELVPAGSPESMRGWADQLVARAREDGIALTGEGGLLTDLMRHVLQTGLEVEMAEHLGYGRGEAPPGGVGNARNGAYDKTVTTEIGEVASFLASSAASFVTGAELRVDGGLLARIAAALPSKN